MAAADNFFNIDAGQPPQRVGGPRPRPRPRLSRAPRATRSPGTPAKWARTRRAVPRSPRSTTRITVAYGARANEEAHPLDHCQHRGLCGDDVLAERSERAGPLRRAAASASATRSPIRRTGSRSSRTSRPSLPSRRPRSKDATKRQQQRKSTLEDLLQRHRRGAAGRSRGADPGAADAAAGLAADDVDALPAEHRQLSLGCDYDGAADLSSRAGCQRPSRPAASSRLMLISGASFSRLRLAHQRDRLVHHEHAEIGDVLADELGQRIVRARHRSQENRPELAIVQQRLVDLIAVAPVVVHRLQPRRGLEQQVRFQLTRT